MPNFTLYPGILPHMAHMRLKTNMPSFFMQDELKIVRAVSEITTKINLSAGQVTLRIYLSDSVRTCPTKKCRIIAQTNDHLTTCWQSLDRAINVTLLMRLVSEINF